MCLELIVNTFLSIFFVSSLFLCMYVCMLVAVGSDVIKINMAVFVLARTIKTAEYQYQISLAMRNNTKKNRYNWSICEQ